MQVFYVNIGGGEPTVRKDFWELVAYATAHDVGVKFSTNGSRIAPERAAWLAAGDYVDVQISLDGATAEVNDAIRGPGSHATADIAWLRETCAYLWGMAANGEAGVKNVLEILRGGIDETLVGLGRESIHDLTPDDLVMAPDFVRAHTPRTV